MVYILFHRFNGTDLNMKNLHRTFNWIALETGCPTPLLAVHLYNPPSFLPVRVHNNIFKNVSSSISH